MRKHAVASAVAAAVLVLSSGILAQTAGPQASAAAPDLTGVWRRSRQPPDNARKYTMHEIAGTLTNEKPPMTAWGEAQFKAAKPNIGPRGVPISQSNDPVTKCFSSRRSTNLRDAGRRALWKPRRFPAGSSSCSLNTINFPCAKSSRMDGHIPSDSIPSWMGDSIGKWEGDTLVVDTVGFNDKSWLDGEGHPHSDQLHLVERIRRVRA